MGLVNPSPEWEDVVPYNPLKRWLVKTFLPADVHLVRFKEFNAKARLEGKDWPQSAHTMIGMKRLDNIQYCVEQVLANLIPGDLIETGVWKGGACIIDRDRRIYTYGSNFTHEAVVGGVVIV